MINPNLICYRCMTQLTEQGAPCPHCGAKNGELSNQSCQLPIGSILAGKYFVGCALGQGGFGITYIGWELNLNYRVAIKEYYPENYAGRDVATQEIVYPLTSEKSEMFARGRTRFVEEASALAKFKDDPGIVGVLNFFSENGTAYIVMHYIEGKTLKMLAKENGGKLSAEDSLRYFRPIIESLANVHKAGLLHRDISPDNIIVRNGDDSSAVLLDFGAVRQMSAFSEHSNTISVKHGFAPEEQYRTQGEQGPWTDIYAICATLYRLVTGVTPPQAMDRALSGIPLTPPNALGANLTNAQEAAILKGMSIRGMDRQQSIQELQAQLYAPTEADPVKHVLKLAKRPALLIAAATVCVLIAAIALLPDIINRDAGRIASPGGVSALTGVANDQLDQGSQASGEQFTADDFKYEVVDGNAVIVDYLGAGNDLVIPRKLNGRNVVKIKKYAFSGCRSLVSVEIPDTIKGIDEGAFYKCTSLAKVELPDSVREVGACAFYGTPWLSEQKPEQNDNFIILGKNAVWVYVGDSASVTVPFGATNVDFTENKQVTAVTLPASMERINNSAFENCSSLETVNMPDSITSIGEYAFASCSALKEIVVPGNVTEIMTNAFSECAALNSVSFPEGLLKIGEQAFKSCASLSSLEIPESMQSIGAQAFYHCSELEIVSIPKNIAEIGAAAFADTPWLGILCNRADGDYLTLGNNASNIYVGVSKNITVPSSIHNPDFFENQDVVTITLENGIAEIQSHMFSDCVNLTSVSIPSTVTKIGDHAFENCALLSNASLPDSLVSIGKSSFAYCEKLADISLPDSLTEIGHEAFYGCIAVQEIRIPEKTTKLGNSVLSDCKSLRLIEVAQGNRAYCSADGVLMDLDKKVLIAYPAAMEGEHYQVPDGVVAILPNAFESNQYLKSITLSDTVRGTSFGYAFYDCMALEKFEERDNPNYAVVDGVLFTEDMALLCRYPLAKPDEHYTVPDGVDKICGNAFSGCSELSSLTLPNSINTIEDFAFDRCTKLKEVRLPLSLETIGRGLFANCTSLPNLTIPESVTTIANGAFSSCKALQNVNLPSNLTHIGEWAFFRCENLKSITIPGGVESVSGSVFGFCTAMTSVVVESGVKALGATVFVGCDALQTITLPASVTHIDISALPHYYNNPNMTIRCPKGSAAALYAQQNKIQCKYIS